LHGERRINAIWLWGGSTAINSPAVEQAGLQALARCHLGLPASHVSANAETLVIDTLMEAALAGDWSVWLAAMAELDASHISPLLAQLKQGEINGIRLVLSDSTRADAWEVRPSSMRKFWVRASLARLAP
jgi:hypothetical protein